MTKVISESYSSTAGAQRQTVLWLELGRKHKDSKTYTFYQQCAGNNATDMLVVDNSLY